MSPLSHDRMVVVTFNIYDIIVSMKIRSDVKRKALLLLASGVALGLVSSPKKYFRILENLPKAWKEINSLASRNWICPQLHGLQKARYSLGPFTTTH